MRSQPGASPGGRWLGPAVALLFGLLAALPLWLGAGFLNTRGGGDSPFLLFRLHQLTAALAQGVFPVRWMPDAAFGLGYPFFNYYAALPYFLAAILKLVGLPYVASLVLAQTLGFALAAWGMYAWLNQAGLSRPAAWLGAAAYTFAPFHLVNVYVRGDSLSELWAFAWYPLILLAALRLARRPSLRRALPLALAYAALVLTHNISALLFTPVLLVYGVWLLFTGNWLLVSGNSPTKDNSQLPITNYRPPLLFVGLAAAALTLGLALSAFFWLPALLEGGYGQLEPVTQGYFNYSQHFRGFDLVQFSLLFDYGISGEPGASTPFTMGLIQTLLVAAGLGGVVYGLIRGRLTAHDAFGVVGLAAATFMITPLSRWLWEAVPLLPFVQFPWRFLSVQSLFAALVASRLLVPWEVGQAQASPRASLLRSPAWLGLGLSMVLALAALPSLRLEFIPVGDGDVTAQRLQLYEYFSGNIGSTIRHEYLPRWVVPRPYTSDELLLRQPRVKALVGRAEGTRVEKAADRQEWQIAVDTPQALVAVPLHYWPGWTAQVDGEDVDVAAAPGLGWMAFVVPQGEHTVTLRLGRTPVRGVSEAISWLAWLLLAFLGLRSLSRSAFTLGRFAWGLAVLLGLGLSIGLAALLPRPAPSILRLSADFDQLAYFNAAPIRFADGPALTGYDYSGDRLARGQTLEVTSLWTGLENLEGAQADGVLELVTAPAPLRPVETVFASAGFDPAEVTITQLGIPATIPPGVYLLRLRLESGGEPLAALTPGAQARGAVYLRPVWVDDAGLPATGDGLAADFGPAVRLLNLDGSQSSLDAVDVQMAWQTEEDVPQNYALALRLNDRAGAEWAALDTQPALGFYPTGFWRPGEVVHDSLRLPIPLGTPPGDYVLTLTLYEAGSLAPVGQAAQPVSLAVAAPATADDVSIRVSDALGLSRLEAPATLLQGDSLNLSVGWVALQGLPAGLQAQWTLTPELGDGPFEVTAPLSSAADPENWPSGALILGRASLRLPADLPPGRYALGLNLLDGDGEIAGSADGLAVVEVVERERLTAAPSSARRLRADFGEALALEAYELDQDARSLTLTPYWRARTQPAQNFKYFVHVFDPATEQIAAQADGFPRGGTYPTAQWAAGEVVSDSIRISLADVPPGTYQVALGWYDPQNPAARLAARDAEGDRLDQDRLVLPEEITVGSG